MTEPDEQPDDYGRILDILDRICSDMSPLTDLVLVGTQHMETESQREIIGNLSEAYRTFLFLRQEFQKARISRHQEDHH